jgi:ElaA protein
LPKIALQITTEWRRFDELSAPALYDLLRLRQQIFVVEQRSPYPDLDGFDQLARHLLLRAKGALAGCLRLLPPSAGIPMVRIGRVAVIAELRGQGLGHRLMREALWFCRAHHPGQPVRLAAQRHLAHFYQALGFAEIGEPYDDFDITHIDMWLAPATAT